MNEANKHNLKKAWWKESVVYQIYPRSFQDSNGDGIGDLQGILQRLDYIKRLGADVIWLCPIYRSPNDDNGYDISDYCGIMPEFGTMEDFDALLSAAHEKGMKIVLDLVVNHTSDEHRWFAESRRSRENPYRDYYIWREGKNGGAPNNWGSVFSGPAWKQDEATGMYYLHLFSEKQPDLNWTNPAVRGTVFHMMKWWLDKGIDGFRMDVINYISKDAALPDGPVKGGAYGDFEPYVKNGLHVHDYLREMNREVLSRYDIMTVGETPGVTVEEAKKYAGENTGELNMVFQFEHMGLDSGENGKWSDKRFRLADLKRVMTKWQKGLDGCAWNSLYWNNHDQPRAVSRFGNDTTPLLWEKSAKMLATCLHMLQGTPYIYQGEELGMTNVAFNHLEDYRDIETINAYHEMVDKEGVAPETMMEYIHRISRDNARTPMQWSARKNADFTDGAPWIGVNPNYTKINAELELADPNSIFHYYRKLIALRRQYPVIVYGSYDLLMENSEEIYAYLRTLNDEKILVLCNFSNQSVQIPASPELILNRPRLLIANYNVGDAQREVILRPYEARVYLEETEGSREGGL